MGLVIELREGMRGIPIVLGCTLGDRGRVTISKSSLIRGGLTTDVLTVAWLFSLLDFGDFVSTMQQPLSEGANLSVRSDPRGDS